jgi:hypothetical protein
MHHISTSFSQLSHRGTNHVRVTATEDKLVFESDKPFKLVANSECLRIESEPKFDSGTVISHGIVSGVGATFNFIHGQMWVNGVCHNQTQVIATTSPSSADPNFHKTWTTKVCKLNAVDVGACGTLKIIADCFSTDDLELKASGSGSLTILTPTISCKTATVAISGSGAFHSEGMAASSCCKIRSIGSGDAAIAKLTSPLIYIESSGSGNAEIYDISGVDLTVQSNGSGSIKCDSKHVFETCNLTCSGSGTMRVAVKAQDVRATLCGSGDMRGFYAVKTLVATMQGFGDLVYAADPSCTIQKVKSGSGTLRART